MSLPELLLGFGIFLLFLGGVFGLFTRGYQAFQFLTDRQSIQGQLLRIKGVMEADFRMSHFRSVGREQRTATVEGHEVRRDIACCLILDDWQNPDNYRQPTGIPLWNRYAVYQTDENAEGQLLRLVVAPDRAFPLRVRPLEELTNITEPLVGRQLLSSNLRAFSCEPDRYMQEVVVSFELRQVGGQRGVDYRKTSEAFKAVFHWTPNNTVPRF